MIDDVSRLLAVAVERCISSLIVMCLVAEGVHLPLLLFIHQMNMTASNVYATGGYVFSVMVRSWVDMTISTYHVYATDGINFPPNSLIYFC